MPITSPFTRSITYSVAPPVAQPVTRSSAPSWWLRAAEAIGPSLAAVGYAFGAPVDPRSFARRNDIRGGS